MKKKEVKEKKIVFDSELVEHYTDQIHDGVILKRFQNPWLKGEIGLRRSGVVFQMAKEEQEEYIKCAIDIHYFTEKYCKVKTEDGTINNIRLRKYQKDVLDDFVGKRFNILCASRQVGKCLTFNTLVSINTGNDFKNIRIGKLYYDTISSFRKLTLIEKIKIKLYNILYFIEN
jgi:hypothetical protein